MSKLTTMGLGFALAFTVAAVAIAQEAGESIWTESSHKFTEEDVRALGRRASFEVVAEWRDHEWPFLQVLFRAT